MPKQKPHPKPHVIPVNHAAALKNVIPAMHVIKRLKQRKTITTARAVITIKTNKT